MQAHSEGEILTAARCDECEVTTRWLGFYRVWQGSGEVFDTVDLFLPDVQFNTQVSLSLTTTSNQGAPLFLKWLCTESMKVLACSLTCCSSAPTATGSCESWLN